MQDNKNLFLALALSLLVIVGWNAFFGVPQMRDQRQQGAQTGTAQPQPGAPTPSNALPQSPSAAQPATAAAEPRETVLARGGRVAVETPSIKGSIALTGGRVDDIALRNYRETVQPSSPNIVLFSPAGTRDPYYAEFGWHAPAGAGQVLPSNATVWTADAPVLTPERPVTLTFDNGQGLVFRRTIAVDAKAMFTVRDGVENRTGAPVQLQPYAYIFRQGTPTTLGYYILHEGLIGVLGEAGLQEYTYSAIEKDRAKTWSATGGWVGITDKYWASALVPDQGTPFEGSFLTGAAGPVKTYSANAAQAVQTVEPGATREVQIRLFAGAKEVRTIDAYEAALGIRNFDRLIDWGWFYFITKPLFQLIDFFFRLFGNFGVAILLVTVLVKAVFFPLANKSYASMAKMKALQPEMVAIRERNGDDRMKQQQELMALYKTAKINPIAGCWPVLVQVPVFFALYKVLFVTIEMRHAPFFGWIQDLAAPDPTSVFNLFGLLPYSVPEFLLLGVWPLVMGVTMFLQMKMNPEPPDPVQKAMFAWMPVIFTYMLASFPAGLVIYWTWNNTLSVAQQYAIMRRQGVKVELWDNLRGLLKKPQPKPAE